MMRRDWSYYCPKCREGFGDLEGEIIKDKYDGFGDRNKLIICPRCSAWLVLGAYMTCDEFNIEDLEFWGLNESQIEQAKQAGYVPGSDPAPETSR